MAQAEGRDDPRAAALQPEEGPAQAWAAAAVAPFEPDRAQAAVSGSLAALLETSDTAITVWDMELRCLWANRAGAALQGRTQQAMLGVAIGEVAAPGRMAQLQPLIDAVRAGRPVTYEAQFERDGSLRTRRVRAIPRRLSDGRVDGLIVLTTDITEERARREAVVALAASEARFRALAESLPVGVYHSDARSSNLYTNPRYREITGLSEQASLGDGWRAIVHPDDRERLFAAWRRTTGGAEFEMSLRIVRPDGTVRDIVGRSRPLVGEGGAIVGYIGTNEDVTERLAAERALRESRAMLERANEALRMLYEHTPAMLQSVGVEGRVLSVSDRWLTSLGYERQEVLGRPAVDFLTPGSRDAVLAEYLPRLWRDGREDRLALQVLRRDGSVMDALFSAVVQRDREGRPLRALAVIEDVTALLDRAAQLRREQTARQRLQRQAADLARLANERREMLDLLAHEVRQPLNNASAAIESAGSMLADRGEQGVSARLARAQGVLAEVQRHVDNTLALSTLLASPPAAPEEDADIDTVVAVALAELPREDRARVTVRRQTAARTARMDSALVRLALRNLLGNAIRHTPPATPVTVVISDSDSPLALFIDVIDEGGGLPAELLPHLFERGARVHHRDGRESHGLGMFIAHRALKAQAGDLKLLYSGPPGTALRLVLPQGQGG